MKIDRPDHVWATDITDVRLWQGFVYLVAIMAWYRRDVLSWEVSITLDSRFWVSALERRILISMDSRGQAFENIFVERLWSSVKYEEVYLKDYRSVQEVITGLRSYFEFYNRARLHQSLNYQTSEAVYRQGQQLAAAATVT